MKNLSFRMEGPLKLSEGKLMAHNLTMVPMRISSSPLPNIIMTCPYMVLFDSGNARPFDETPLEDCLPGCRKYHI